MTTTRPDLALAASIKLGKLRETGELDGLGIWPVSGDLLGSILYDLGHSAPVPKTARVGMELPVCMTEFKIQTGLITQDDYLANLANSMAVTLHRNYPAGLWVVKNEGVGVASSADFELFEDYPQNLLRLRLEVRCWDIDLTEEHWLALMKKMNHAQMKAKMQAHYAKEQKKQGQKKKQLKEQKGPPTWVAASKAVYDPSPLFQDFVDAKMAELSAKAKAEQAVKIEAVLEKGTSSTEALAATLTGLSNAVKSAGVSAKALGGALEAIGKKLFGEHSPLKSPAFQGTATTDSLTMDDIDQAIQELQKYEIKEAKDSSGNTIGKIIAPKIGIAQTAKEIAEGLGVAPSKLGVSTTHSYSNDDFPTKTVEYPKIGTVNADEEMEFITAAPPTSKPTACMKCSTLFSPAKQRCPECGAVTVAVEFDVIGNDGGLSNAFPAAWADNSDSPPADLPVISQSSPSPAPKARKTLGQSKRKIS